MPKSRMIITLGVLVALLPALGFPRAWESFFQIFAGLSIVTLSVWAQIDKKLKLQAKAHQRLARKAAENGVVPKVPEATPIQGKRITDFYPKTGQPGRRITDIKPILSQTHRSLGEVGEPPREPINELPENGN